MWSRISKYFTNYPSRAKVARLLFERGFQVKPPDRIVSGEIEVPHTQVAKEIGVDRRVVKETVEMILENPELKKIYENLRQTCSLIDAAKYLGMDVIVFVPEDAKRPGIVAEVTKRISEKGLSIRQLFAEDPEASEEPKLVIVIDGKVPPDLIVDLKNIPGARKVILQ
ncbi:MAG: amino acid-binding protein [Thermoprotei archaeon ex4572_64]|nr:MAG: amino acid-binding protein [Thermoprotei archaeon ex4572_64]